MCLELGVEGGFQQTVILSPIGPEVGGDVGVEVGVAVVQGEGEGEEEPAETGENPWPVVKYFHCFGLTHCVTMLITFHRNVIRSILQILKYRL